jgi:hypothetical protein
MTSHAVAGHSVLVVPVPALEAWVQARHAHYDPAYVSADPTFAHAHITVLGPFVDLAELPAVTERVGEIVGAATDFDFALEQVATFPNGIVHLVPEPEEPFAALTAALWRAFPAYPPYAGVFPHVRPHLTLDALGPDVTEVVIRESVAPLVPVVCRAERVQLSWYQAGACHTAARWRLAPGGSGSLSAPPG